MAHAYSLLILRIFIALNIIFHFIAGYLNSYYFALISLDAFVPFQNKYSFIKRVRSIFIDTATFEIWIFVWIVSI
jgi:hypothetical protein